MNWNTLLIKLLAATLLACAPSTHAADAARGKQLHDANCTSCHTQLMNGNPTAIFTRPNSIIHSFDGLKKRVRFCETMTGANWGDKEIDDVIAYLNQEFYKFK